MNRTEMPEVMSWPETHDIFIERVGRYLLNYLNDPRVTPEDQLVTEILVPTA
ncbi:MAG TPA: hypothetical protein VKR52_19325 [Terracidiphilus sp.]|nr:hypothetical protein [Terracidiphilus sp.]